MSNKEIPEVLRKFQQQSEDDKDLDKRKSEVQKKRLLVDEYKLTNELNRIIQAEQDVEKVSQVNVNYLSDEAIKDLQDKTRYFLEGAKNGMLFLNESFNRVIPAYSGNLILMASRTGGGKSSMTANLVFSTMKQINPINGKHRKTLVISCEETAHSVYARLTCLHKKWNFDNQQDFTDEQKQELIDFIPKWARTGGVTVIGEDGAGITSSIDGIRSIFKNLVDNNVHYDLIIIDYIQKVNTSRRNPNMKSHEVMRETVNFLDVMKNTYPALIVIFSQLSAQNEEGTKSFEERLRGCHDLLTPATIGIEIQPDYKLSMSQFIIHKNRYNGATVGSSIYNLYDKGQFIPTTKEEIKKRKEQAAYKQELGGVFKEPQKEEKGE